MLSSARPESRRALALETVSSDLAEGEGTAAGRVAILMLLDCTATGWAVETELPAMTELAGVRPGVLFI